MNTKLFNIKEINEKFIQKRNNELIDFNLIEPKRINHRLADFCSKGDIDSVKKIFNSPKYQSYINMNYLNNEIIKQACISGNLSLVEFLLNNPISKANIFDSSGQILMTLIVWKQHKILDYLVFDYGLNENLIPQDVSKNFPNSYLDKILQIRNIKENLIKNLNHKESNNNLTKI